MKNKIVVLASYPPEKSLHGKRVGGVASFTKNTISHFNKDEYEFIVLAEVLEKKYSYTEKNIHVRRIWRKNSISLFINILIQLIILRRQTNKLLFEFEFAIYGNMYITAFMPFILLFARLLGYSTTSVVHQVVKDINELSNHLGLKQETIKIKVINNFMHLFYKLLGLFTNKVIVLDQVHKDNLSIFVKPKKIFVVPHGVENALSEPTRLGKRKVILYFGFIAWYKGADILLNSFLKYKNDNTILIFAGGPSETQKSNPEYMRYYNNFETKAKSDPNVILTGFVKEKDFKYYFKLADIVVLPYRVLMSSSGPLSQALRFEKPFLLSGKLAKYLLTEDFDNGLKLLKLDKKDICLTLNNKIYTKIIDRIDDRNKYKKLKLLSRYLKRQRQWRKQSRIYAEIINL